MKTVFSGIQPTGKVHLGNLLGAINNWVHLSNEENKNYFCVVDLHSLTTHPDPSLMQENINETIKVLISSGINQKNSNIYIQSNVPEHVQLSWILSNFCQIGELQRMTQFKEKADQLGSHAGILTYPVLMAADILLYDANYVPVGKDQLQHLEITRDVAIKFNNKHGETFVIPEAKVNESTKYVTGTNGEKMSKSKGNIIDIFLPEKQLKKQIMSIQTDSTPLEEPKEFHNCNVFKIFKLIADENQVNEMKNKYQSGGYGYGHAKTDLFNLILEKYKDNRSKFDYLMSNKKEIDLILSEGSKKAEITATQVIKRVKTKLGF